MDLQIAAALKHIPFIILGIWPVNLLTLWAQGHAWNLDKTPDAIIGLWEWGAFVSFSLAILSELGGKMFIALAQHRRKREQELAAAKAEGFAEGLAQGRMEELARLTESGAMLDVLNAAARNNPDLLPSLLQEYQARYRNGSATN